MIRQDIQRLKSSVEGRTIFIVGGGASITPEIMEKLNASNTKKFCINSSVKHIVDPIAVLWCDESWASTNKSLLDTYSFPKFYVKSNGNTHIQRDIRGLSNATILNKSGETGFDSDIDNVRGNNSGGYAINLLVNCKAKNIVLVGFDMTTTGNKAHFHNDYTYAIRPSVYSDLFIPSINSLQDVLLKHSMGVNVYNVNKFSKLRCFEFRDLEEFL